MPRKKKQSKAEQIGFPDFEEKYAKYVPEHWVPVANDMALEEMQKHITECEMTIKATKIEVADNDKIQELKDNLKYLQEGFREVVKTQEAKIQLLLHIMNLRGYNIKLHKNIYDLPEEED